MGRNKLLSSSRLKKSYSCIRLILGDQLNYSHSWFQQYSDEMLYVMMEVKSETNYVKQHIQKIIVFFCAMRHFAEKIVAEEHHLIYLTLDDQDNQQSFLLNLKKIVKKYKINQLEYQQPDEYRLEKEFDTFSEALNIVTNKVSSEHFLITTDEFNEFFQGKKNYLMENFYRKMRKQHQILVKDNKPEGGQWNYDIQNRKKCPSSINIPEPPSFSNDIKSIHTMLKKQDIKYFGEIDENTVDWFVTREQALSRLTFFADEQLSNFGQYQDAMTTRHFGLFHSQLSFALNTKMIHPKEVIEKSIEAWKKSRKKIDLAQIEGFIRQILGWREYMRGIYWAEMPEYGKLNYFKHQQKLPGFYWTAETKMKCLNHSIGQSLSTAYAHHIQRLMVTGNFALLLGVHPDDVDSWYLGIYIDAIEWVQLPNTRGMSQYADGGIVGSKPYVASANYMNKMGDYCKQCFYDFKQKIGERACPFNSLYWQFYHRHRKLLVKHPRIARIYQVWEKFTDDEQKKIIKQAKQHIKNVETL